MTTDLDSLFDNAPELEGFIKILLIEDDDVDARLLKIYASSISTAQITVDWVKSTAEARGRLSAGEFDLCIFDFWLRTHSSMSLLADLHRIRENLPIIILSNMTNQHVIEQSISTGAYYFLGKDELNVKSLTNAIREVLAPAGLHRVRRPQAGAPNSFALKARAISLNLVDAMNDMRSLFQRESDSDEISETQAAPDLEKLRLEVANLRLELQSNLRQDFDIASKVRPETYNISGLIHNATRAMSQFLERRSQNWNFSTNFPDLCAKCDPVIVMLMLLEQIYAISAATKPNGSFTIELAIISGRIAIIQTACQKAPYDWADLRLPPFFEEYIGTGEFTYFADTDEKGLARVQLLFPQLLN